MRERELSKYRREREEKCTVAESVPVPPEFKERIRRLKPHFDFHRITREFWRRTVVELERELKAIDADPDQLGAG